VPAGTDCPVYLKGHEVAVVVIVEEGSGRRQPLKNAGVRLLTRLHLRRVCHEERVIAVPAVLGMILLMTPILILFFLKTDI